jgi:16S rRNA (cytidine1402-2'-O)-methyltransferase
MAPAAEPARETAMPGQRHAGPAGKLPLRELLAEIASWPLALVFYEAPHRIAATLAELARALDAGRTLVVARELTKTFETIASMPLAAASAWLAADANRARGEFVLIVDMPSARHGATSHAGAADALLRALLVELPPSRAARVAAAVTGESRDAMYARALALRPPAE